ncbi:MAG: hypothetical protein KAJ69_05685, partial [Thermoplasmatales archaeon]|nr:hypothetical protein [Thermoplasmatales archaeon]
MRLQKNFKLDKNRLKFINARIIYTEITAIRKYNIPLVFFDLFFIFYITFNRNTVISATIIANKKLVAFLIMANFLPKIRDSAGNCIMPTVTHATINAVTAVRL